SAPDLSSWHVYVFSDSGDGDGVGMWVLTIPAFVWVKVPLTNLPFPTGYSMAGHSCATDGRNILIVPGDVTTDDGGYVCNRNKGILVFDAVEWTFVDEYDPAKVGDVGVPDAIVKVVGGGRDGGSRVQRPRDGWDMFMLGQMFER